jgi:hypothetical protein
MTNLIGKIANYTNCVQGLLDRIDEYVEQVKSEVPSEFWKELRIHDFGGSQFTYWAAYCIVDGRKFIIPSGTSKLGTSQYIYGDFNNHQTFANSQQVIEWAKQLPSLEQKLSQKIDSLTETLEQI